MANPHSGRWKLPDSCWPSRHEGRLKEPCTGEEWDGGGPPKPSIWGGEWHGLITRGCRGSICGFENRPEFGSRYVYGSLESLMPHGEPFAQGEIEIKRIHWSTTLRIMVGFNVPVGPFLELGQGKTPYTQVEFPDLGLLSDWGVTWEDSVTLGTYLWVGPLNQLSRIRVIIRTEVRE